MWIRAVRGTAVLAGLSAVWWAGPAAAEVTGCTAITSVPAVISAPGVYCLKQDLASSSYAPSAISIEASNVTLDCNDHRLTGRSGDPGSLQVGIFAIERSRITVRHCNVLRFRWGIALYGNNDPGSGHLVEDNLLEYNREFGIFVTGAGSIVRGNRVIATGGLPGTASARAITVTGDAIDNVVDGVHGPDDATDFLAQGIYAGTTSLAVNGALVERNRVRNLSPKGAGEAQGIIASGSGVMVRENVVGQAALTAGKGVLCNATAAVAGNLVTGFAQSFTPMFCVDAGGNVSP